MRSGSKMEEKNILRWRLSNYFILTKVCIVIRMPVRYQGTTSLHKTMPLGVPD